MMGQMDQVNQVNQVNQVDQMEKTFEIQMDGSFRRVLEAYLWVHAKDPQCTEVPSEGQSKCYSFDIGVPALMRQWCPSLHLQVDEAMHVTEDGMVSRVSGQLAVAAFDATSNYTKNEHGMGVSVSVHIRCHKALIPLVEPFVTSNVLDFYKELRDHLRQTDIKEYGTNRD
jgi:hypothetical protein